jgi:hypothetical protein
MVPKQNFENLTLKEIFYSLLKADVAEKVLHGIQSEINSGKTGEKLRLSIKVILETCEVHDAQLSLVVTSIAFTMGHPKSNETKV